MTPQRAREIVDEAQGRDTSKWGPWSDSLDFIMTVEERDQVRDHWLTLPGTASFVDALLDIAKETTK